MKNRFGYNLVRDDDYNIPVEWQIAMNAKNFDQRYNNEYDKPSIEYVNRRNDLMVMWQEVRSMPRWEMLEEAQVSIDDKWERARKFMTVPDQEPEPAASHLTRRQRLAQSALTGISSGGLSFIPSMTFDKLWLTAAYTPNPALLIGGAAVAGIGYGVYRTRNRGAIEEQAEVALPSHQLSREQIEMLQGIYPHMSHTAGDLFMLSYGDESLRQQVEESLAVVDGKNVDAKSRRMLEWIDRDSHRHAVGQGLDGADDYIRSLQRIEQSAKLLCRESLNRAFHNTSATQTPLSLLALVRMRHRGEFVTKYQTEFQKITEKIDEIRSKYAEIDEILKSQTAINSTSQYFNLRAESVRHEAHILMRDMALMDLRLTALACAYDTNRANAEKDYSPYETETVLEERLELWRQSIDELCVIPMDTMSEPMGEVLIMALHACQERVYGTGDYGKATARVVEYVKSIADVVKDEGQATEAIRKITELLQ